MPGRANEELECLVGFFQILFDPDHYAVQVVFLNVLLEQT
jgi:hypothetical protein